MWNYVSIVLIIIEISLLIWFIFARIRKKRLNETIIFLFLVYIVDLALNLTPLLYKSIALKTPTNYSLEVLDCLVNTANLFIGKVDVENFADFANAFPVFTYAYALGALMALLATISTAIEAFRSTLRNSFTLSRMMKSSVCDLVIGNSETALKYAKNKKAVVLLDSTVTRDSAVTLMKEGYVILCREFSANLLDSRIFNKSTRYNIICPKDENKSLTHLNEFVEYKKSGFPQKNISLYLEVYSDQATAIHREIIEKNELEYCINTFSICELMARTFIENHPLTRYLPDSFISDDTSIKEDVKINVFFLGFGELSREIYNHSVINNQFVVYKDCEYKVFPTNYYIYDPDTDADSWTIEGLAQELDELKNQSEGYLPLPDVPLKAFAEKKSPDRRETLLNIKKKIADSDSYNYIVIDTGNNYKNIEVGARLQGMLSASGNYHLFINSRTVYCESNSKITYYGEFDTVLTHSVIVNDSLSTMAKKMHEVYIGKYYKGTKSEDFVKAEAKNSWKLLDKFTMFSNIYTALNLKTKLNLLGLDYINDGKAQNIELIEQRLQQAKENANQDYNCRCIRNALMAQEHYRWNAYHLMNEYLPMAKNEVLFDDKEKSKVKFIVKNSFSKKHLCLTTFKGLTVLSELLAKEAEKIDGKAHSNGEFDYIINDEIPLCSAAAILDQLKYSVADKRNTIDYSDI